MSPTHAYLVWFIYACLITCAIADSCLHAVSACHKIKNLFPNKTPILSSVALFNRVANVKNQLPDFEQLIPYA